MQQASEKGEETIRHSAFIENAQRHIDLAKGLIRSILKQCDDDKALQQVNILTREERRGALVVSGAWTGPTQNIRPAGVREKEVSLCSFNSAAG